MISKILFMETLDEIQTEFKRYEMLNELLKEYCDGFPVFTIGNKYLNQLIAVLKETSDDTGDLIEWWLYEKAEKIVTERVGDNCIKYDLTTAEALYDYLEKCQKEKAG